MGELEKKNVGLSERISRLYERRTFGIKPGLDTERALLKELGNPETAFGVVHVAGTNGKGSVCAIIESVLRSAGYKTGLYTSPHLVSLHERFRVNGQPVSDDGLDELVEVVEDASREVEAETGSVPTFFECTTAMAFEYFRRMDVEIAIVETGLGGRLDATNVVLPMLSVITSIGLEHTEHLGNSIESIAMEKCGIIKAGRPVVCGDMDICASDVVEQTAAERGSTCMKASDNMSIAVKAESSAGQKLVVESAGSFCGTVLFPLLGSHQVENLGTALTALEWLGSSTLDISDEAVKKGVECVKWPGRMQVLNEAPLILLDGAHNPGGAQSLVQTLKHIGGDQEMGLVAGMCSDKDVSAFLNAFGRTVTKMWIVPVGNERNVAHDVMVNAGRSLGWDVEVSDLDDALTNARAWAERENGYVCITGSLFLVGAVMDTLDITPWDVDTEE